MAVFVSNSVTLSTDSQSQAFTALYADDESYEIVSLPKQRLDWTILENIIGHRNIYTVKIQKITQAQRNFLYHFIQSDAQYLEMNGVADIEVNVKDQDLLLDLLGGYIDNVVLTMELEDRYLTRATTPSRTQGVTTSSSGFSSGMTSNGTTVLLSYNYGSGDTKRLFRVNSVSSYKANILDKRWEYIDKNRGQKRLGYRPLYDIDFGGFGLGQTQSQLADDRAWVKEFVLAPVKYVEVYQQALGNVVNDFDEVRYSFIGSPYTKTTRLAFKGQSLVTNSPTVPNSQFILDSSSYGTLDNNILG